MHIEGYALTHGDYSRYGGPESGGWVEHIDREALERAVAKRPTVPLRVGYDGPIIGDAHLSVDDAGLRFSASINESVPDDAEANARYRVRQDSWSDSDRMRHIFEFSVEDVSIPDQGGTES